MLNEKPGNLDLPSIRGTLDYKRTALFRNRRLEVRVTVIRINGIKDASKKPNNF
jgi:hypothetical protein